MSSPQVNMIKSFQQRGYLRFASPGLDPLLPESCDLISHNKGIVIGPEKEKVAFRELLGAGVRIEDRYHEGAAALLGKIVAHRTQGRFPEHWVGVSTGDRRVDEETISRIVSYTLSTFSHLIDPDDKAALDGDCFSTKNDLLCVAHRLDRCLEEVAETEDHPQLGLWRQNVSSVVDNFMRGVHVVRVNRKLDYDNGSMLAFFVDVAPASGAFIGTKYGIQFSTIRKKLEDGSPLESFLNHVQARAGAWHLVRGGQPFKATAGVVAELVMRDGQQSSKLLGGNADMALTDEAVVGPERVKKQFVGPRGPVNKSLRTWKMGAGKLSLRGIEFVAKGAKPFVHKEMDRYQHVRVMDGAVTLLVRDSKEVLEAGESALVLPGAAFKVRASKGYMPSTYVVSTLTSLGSTSRMGVHG